jgi:DNA mismatch repair protein MutS
MMAPPLSETFVHRQTTAQAVRFTTPELSELESRILGAADEAAGIERRIFEGLRDHVLAHAEAVAASAEALAALDVASAMAALATEEDWCRPAVDASRAFRVEGGRHPVVERALRRAGGPGFVANDCDLSGGGGGPGSEAGAARREAADASDEGTDVRVGDATPDGGPARVWLLTGPNMGGKSTFLRQNALIAVLAQAGSFVPARAAHVGLVSQLFSRVGASDDLARGRSTFMVEMVETAAILHQADDRSLVILDEIGRGTATYDGLSIAWACFEHLHERGARCLFATHYHEMTALADRLPGAANATLAVSEHGGEVVLLHEVRPGAADRSYGVQVARLAGLPEAVVERARAVLAALEEGSGAKPAAVVDDLPLFSAAPPEAPPPPRRFEVEARLAHVHPDGLTPREALELLYELKALVAERAPRRNGAAHPSRR